MHLVGFLLEFIAMHGHLNVRKDVQYVSFPWLRKSNRGLHSNECCSFPLSQRYYFSRYSYGILTYV